MTKHCARLEDWVRTTLGGHTGGLGEMFTNSRPFLFRTVVSLLIAFGAAVVWPVLSGVDAAVAKEQRPPVGGCLEGIDPKCLDGGGIGGGNLGIDIGNAIADRNRDEREAIEREQRAEAKKRAEAVESSTSDSERQRDRCAHTYVQRGVTYELVKHYSTVMLDDGTRIRVFEGTSMKKVPKFVLVQVCD